MKTKLLSLEEAQDYLGKDGQARNQGEDLSWAKEFLRTAMERELTQRQRECVERYYFEGKTMERIGEELGIGKGTVCRHLQKSRERLERALKYVEMGRRREEKRREKDRDL